MTVEEAPRVRSQGSFFMIIYEINPKFIATGSYSDILRKENGLWKFSQRKIEFKTGARDLQRSTVLGDCFCSLSQI